MSNDLAYAHFAIRHERDGWHVYFTMDRAGLKKEHVGGPYPTREEAMGRTEGALAGLEEKFGSIQLTKAHEIAIAPAQQGSKCPGCGALASAWTPDGYWRRGMLCPKCGHEFRA